MRADTDRRERFEAVASDVYAPLQRYLRRRANVDDAAEVLNDALLVIWRRLDDVPHDDPLPWCYRVAQGCLANQRRGAGRRLRLVQRASSEARVRTRSAEVTADPQMIVEGADPELAGAIARLSEAEAEIIRLWAWEQLEPREIAVVLGTTANAVSVALNRSRRKLADSLGRQNAPYAGQEAGVDAKENERTER